MSTKPVILLDVDGVLTDHSSLFMAKVNRRFGTSYTYEQIQDWEYSHMEKTHKKFVYSEECWNDRFLYDLHSLDDDQIATIDWMREVGLRVCACTSPMSGHIRSKYQFLQRYFDHKDIYICGDKTLVRGDLLVDDGPHNLEAFPGATIIFDRPWNQGIPGIRVTYLSEIIQHLPRLLSCYSGISLSKLSSALPTAPSPIVIESSSIG